MLVELSMLVAAGLACSTLAMPLSRAEAAVPAEPAPVVQSSSQERDSDDSLLPLDSSWLVGATGSWAVSTPAVHHAVSTSEIAPEVERVVSPGPPAFLLESAVQARTYH